MCKIQVSCSITFVFSMINSQGHYNAEGGYILVIVQRVLRDKGERKVNNVYKFMELK